MKKIVAIEALLVALLVGVMFLLLSGANVREDVTAEEVEAVSTRFVARETFSAKVGTELNAKRYMDLNVADYSAYVYYVATQGMDVHEFLWVDAGSEEGAEEVLKVMNERLTSQMEAFGEGYGPEQMVLLEKACVFSMGRYAVYIVSEDSEAWKSAIADVLEE